MKNIIAQNNGSTVLGTLVSVGILVVVGGIAIQSFQDPKDSVTNIRRVSRCQELADQITNSIQSESPVQEITSLSQAELSQITSVSHNPFSEILNLNSNPLRLNQDKRIKGSLNSLKSLLAVGRDSQNRNFCSSQYGGLPTNVSELASLFALANDATGEMKNVEATLKVQLMDLNTGSLSCDSNLSPLPAGRDFPARAVANSIVADDSQKRTNIGYLATVHIRYKGSKDEDKNCQSQTLVKYPKVYDLNLNVGSIQINIPSPSQCQATQLAANIKVTPPASWGLRGIVPLCRDTSTPGSGENCQGGVKATSFSANSRWLPCHLTTLCGKAPSSFTYNADGSIDMRYADLPWACTAQMDTQFVDMGLNSLKTPFMSSNVVRFPSCDNCGNYGWLGGSFCPTGAYTSYCSPPPPPPPPEPPGGLAGGGNGNGNGGSGLGNGNGGSGSGGGGGNGGGGSGGGGGNTPSAPPGSPEWLVRQAYITVLGREPDAGGAHGWTNAVKNGMSPMELFNNFENSLERRMQRGESVQQAEIDRHQKDYDTYTQKHNITNPQTLCNSLASCGSHWSD